MRTPRPGRAARTARTVLAALCLAVPCLAAGGACGVQPTGVVGVGPRPTAEGAAAPVTMYLVWEGRLRPVTRPGLPSRPHLAIEQLSVPVTLEEHRRGFSSAIPEKVSSLHAVLKVTEVGTQGLARGVINRVLIILAKDAPSRERWPRIALGQLACTAEAIPGVARAELQDLPDQPGHRLGTCGDYGDLLA